MVGYQHANPQVIYSAVGLSEELKFFTPATKLGQGYVFTRVCDSFDGGGLPRDQRQAPPPDQRQTPPGLRHPPGADPPNAVHAGRYGQQTGGTNPTGMQSCSLKYLPERWE